MLAIELGARVGFDVSGITLVEKKGALTPPSGPRRGGLHIRPGEARGADESIADWRARKAEDIRRRTREAKTPLPKGTRHGRGGLDLRGTVWERPTPTNTGVAD